MLVTYIFHSCFVVELSQHILIFDYSIGKLPAFDTKKKVIFFVSHIHHDHYSKSIWEYANSNTCYIIDSGIKFPDNVDALQVIGNKDYKFHDMRFHTLTSTDLGVAFLIEIEGKTIYHAGDLNWWHWEGEPDRDNTWQNQAFHHEIEFLRDKHIDVAFLPLDPRQEKNAWWGFLDILKICKIAHVFPMHFGHDIKKMQAYLTIDELAPYQQHITTITSNQQSFSFK